MRSLVLNHPFIDGNKRMGLAATGVFLYVNGYDFNVTQREMIDFTVSLAKSEPPMATSAVATWLRRSSRRLAGDVWMSVQRISRGAADS